MRPAPAERGVEATVTSSKAARILRRTLVGGSLVLVIAGVLWLTSRSPDGRVLFWVTAIVTLVAVWETSRMGTLALVDLRPALLFAALGVIVLLNAGIEQWEASRELVEAGVAKAARPPFFEWGLLRGYLHAPIVALAAYGIAALHLPARSRAGARLLAYAIVGFLILVSVHDLGSVHDRLGLARGILGGLAVATAVPILLSDPHGVRRLARVAGIALWLVPPLPLVWLVWATWGISGLVSLLVLSKIGDTFGYYVGSALGKTHPFPRLSPGKTTAGCVGSFVGATTAGGVLFATGILPATPYGLGGALCAAALINLASQAGDLLESFVKRRAGVKDSSALFGPSGGLLDQIDSLLLSVPMALLTWPWIFAVPG